MITLSRVSTKRTVGRDIGSQPSASVPLIDAGAPQLLREAQLWRRCAQASDASTPTHGLLMPLGDPRLA